MNGKSVIRLWMSRPSDVYDNMSEEEQRALWVKLARKYEYLSHGEYYARGISGIEKALDVIR